MNLEHVTEIRASRERVFDYISNPEKLRLWAKGMEERTDLTPGRHGVGTRFRQRIREGGRVTEYEGEILAYDPPAHLQVRMARGPLTMTMEYRLSTPSPAVTQLHQRLSIESASRIMRWLAPLFSAFTRRLMRRQAQALKELVEQP